MRAGQRTTHNHGGVLTLVNAQHALPPDDMQPRLQPLHPSCPTVLVDGRLCVPWKALMDAIGGWDALTAVSGYRSAEEQAALYENSLREYGAAYTHKYVAKCGHSEHQTGLAIDMALRGDAIHPIAPSFPREGVSGQFGALAPQYGFILRYPKGKEVITGIAHEPWHFRYVGILPALAMARQGLTLEEYLTA